MAKMKKGIKVLIVVGIIVVVLIAGVIRIFSGGKSHGKETEASAIEESTFQASDISVNGISLPSALPAISSLLPRARSIWRPAARARRRY